MYFSLINMTIKGLTCKWLMTKQKSQFFCISFAHKTYTKTLQHKDTFITVGFFTTHFHINEDYLLPRFFSRIILSLHPFHYLLVLFSLFFYFVLYQSHSISHSLNLHIHLIGGPSGKCEYPVSLTNAGSVSHPEILIFRDRNSMLV